MEINNTYNTSFKGGFRFPNMPQEAKEKLPELIRKRKQIFDNFEKEGDVFYLVRDSWDKRVMRFIQEHKLKFEYYPQISTKSGLDTEEPEGLTKLLKKLKPKPVTTITQLRKAISTNIQASLVKSPEEENIKRIFDALRLDFENYKSSTSLNGCIVLTDIESGKRIHISPASKNGINYVLVEPKSLDLCVERYAIAEDGQILAEYKTPDGIRQFKKNFNDTLAKKW